jgi:four helix bundle protein
MMKAGRARLLSGMMPYERFEAWRLCHRLNIDLCRLAKNWDKKGYAELKWQTYRAAWSVPANIVEGSTKRGAREFRRFLDITLGSLAEVSYALRVARDLEVITVEEWKAIDQHRAKASKVTWSLYNSVREAAQRQKP